MNFDLDGDRIVGTYDMDGSKWIFLGFSNKFGEHYMKLKPHEDTLRKDPNWSDRYEVHLPRSDYQIIHDHIIRTPRPRKSSEILLEKFFDCGNEDRT